MPYRFEMHFHTAEVSPCGNIPAAEGIVAYKKQGYSGVVVTDHYAGYNFERFSGDWEQKLDAYLTGARAAMEAGARVGLTVLLGMELRLDRPLFGAPCNEYLVYGVTEEQLRRYRELYLLTEPELAKLSAELGWFIAQAHPCRTGMTFCPAEYLQGVEIFNGNRRHDSHNREAAAFCEQHNLIGIAGSDFHEWEDLGAGGVDFFAPVNGPSDLLRQLRNREFSIVIPAKERRPKFIGIEGFGYVQDSG